MAKMDKSGCNLPLRPGKVRLKVVMCTELNYFYKIHLTHSLSGHAVRYWAFFIIFIFNFIFVRFGSVYTQ